MNYSARSILAQHLEDEHGLTRAAAREEAAAVPARPANPPAPIDLRLRQRVVALAKGSLAGYRMDPAARAAEVEMLAEQIEEAIKGHLESLGLERVR